MLALHFVFVSDLHLLPGCLWVTLASGAAFLCTDRGVLWFWVFHQVSLACWSSAWLHPHGKLPNAAKGISLLKFPKPLRTWSGLNEVIELETVTVNW